MVLVKAYSHSEIRSFDIEAEATFAQLQQLVVRQFGLSKEVEVTIDHCDRDGNVVSLSSDLELRTALNKQDVWNLQILVQRKEEVHHRLTPLWDWGPFNMHDATREPFRRGGFFDSVWNNADDDSACRFEHRYYLWFKLPLPRQHKIILAMQRKHSEMMRRHVMHQISVDAKRASNEVQAQTNGGEVAEKKPKVVIHQYYGYDWKPKPKGGSGYVLATCGRWNIIICTHGGEESASGYI